MIAYFDTSAMLPLMVSEPGTALAASFWNRASRIASVRLVYPEARAALARANRLGRIDDQYHRQAVNVLDSYVVEMLIVDVDQTLAVRAGDLAQLHHLRGYDAVHLAAAERIADALFVAGDRDLIRAARSEGFHVAVID